MPEVVFITPAFAVTSALTQADFEALRLLGFRSIVSNRPDNEEDGQLLARREAAHAWQAGMKFRHVPATKHDLFTDAAVEGMGEALRQLDGPVVAHCKTGLRSAILWAAASARTQPVDCVLAALTAAGFDLDFLRDDLEQQAHRPRWLGVTAALDCAGGSVARHSGGVSTRTTEVKSIKAA